MARSEAELDSGGESAGERGARTDRGGYRQPARHAAPGDHAARRRRVELTRSVRALWNHGKQPARAAASGAHEDSQHGGDIGLRGGRMKTTAANDLNQRAQRFLSVLNSGKEFI